MIKDLQGFHLSAVASAQEENHVGLNSNIK